MPIARSIILSVDFLVSASLAISAVAATPDFLVNGKLYEGDILASEFAS